MKPNQLRGLACTSGIGRKASRRAPAQTGPRLWLGLVSVLSSLCLSLPTALAAAEIPFLGAWTKSQASGEPFDFSIRKAGVFSTSGHIKWSVPFPKVDAGRRHQTQWWLTHRLSPGETLSVDAGKKLAATLRQEAQARGSELPATIQIDIEPLHWPTGERKDWLLHFAKAFRTELAGAAHLHFAIPGIQEWDTNQTLQLVQNSDGVALMVYDTGARETSQYQQHLQKNLDWLLQIMPEFQDKTFVLGLPVYYDKTAKHRSSVENLQQFISVWSKQIPEARKSLCSSRLQVALYAAWTMTPEDTTFAKALKDEWNLCRNPKG